MHNLNRTKNNSEPHFFCKNLAFVVKQQNDFLNKKETHKNKMGTLVFLFVQRKVLFQKSTGDVWKTLFSAGFAFCFLNFFGFLYTSSCCFINHVLSSGCCFVFFGLLLFHYLFWFGFVLFFLFLLGGFKGQVRWPGDHLTWPWTLLICFGLFFGVFCLLFFVASKAKPIFPAKKGIFAHFSLSAFVSSWGGGKN